MELTFLALAGVAAGFINVVAAGGSMIGLPALMFLAHLPADVANGTNRMAIILQNIVSVLVYRRRNYLPFRKASWLALPALLGSIFGASLASYLPTEIIEKFIALFMIFMLASLFIKPNYLYSNSRPIPKKLSIKEFFAFFLVGAYGGFLQLGVGFLLLAAATLISNFKLVQANALKVFIVLAFNLVAFSIFALNDLVDFQAGFSLSIGTMLGGWIGTIASIKGGAKFIRSSLAVVIVASISKLLGFF